MNQTTSLHSTKVTLFIIKKELKVVIHREVKKTVIKIKLFFHESERVQHFLNPFFLISKNGRLEGSLFNSLIIQRKGFRENYHAHKNVN